MTIATTAAVYDAGRCAHDSGSGIQTVRARR